MGRERPEIGSSVRSLVRGSYLVFYDGGQARTASIFCGFGMAGADFLG